MKRHFPFAVLATAALLTIAGCGTQVVNPVSGRTERSAMSLQQEVAAGREAHQGVLKEYAVVDDARLQAYVTALGNKLAAQSHRAELEWHFTVLDSPEVNAFALPGGYVYVTRGILAYMENEAGGKIILTNEACKIGGVEVKGHTSFLALSYARGIEPLSGCWGVLRHDRTQAIIYWENIDASRTYPFDSFKPMRER